MRIVCVVSLQVPKVTIDTAALKKGIWNNTWKNWGEQDPEHLNILFLLASPS